MERTRMIVKVAATACATAIDAIDAAANVITAKADEGAISERKANAILGRLEKAVVAAQRASELVYDAIERLPHGGTTSWDEP